MVKDATYYDSHYSERAPTPGVIYAMRCPAWPGSVKIGCTSRDPEERARELFTTAVPEPWQVVGTWATDDMVGAEQLIHDYLKDYRYNEKREFFKLGADRDDYINRVVEGCVKRVDGRVAYAMLEQRDSLVLLATSSDTAVSRVFPGKSWGFGQRDLYQNLWHEALESWHKWHGTHFNFYYPEAQPETLEELRKKDHANLTCWFFHRGVRCKRSVADGDLLHCEEHIEYSESIPGAKIRDGA